MGCPHAFAHEPSREPPGAPVRFRAMIRLDSERVSMPETVPIRGSCHCGGVAFEIRGKPGPMGHCHCTRCRKACGGAFWTALLVRAADFRYVRGRELVERYVPDPPYRHVRCFCRRCGCFLGEPDSGERFPISAAILDDDPGSRPQGHEWVADGAPWYEIEDDLPRFERGFPAAPAT